MNWHGPLAAAIALVTPFTLVPGGLADVDKTHCVTTNPGVPCGFFCLEGATIVISGGGSSGLEATAECGGATATCETLSGNHCQDSAGPTTSEGSGICEITAAEGTVVCGNII